MFIQPIVITSRTFEDGRRAHRANQPESACTLRGTDKASWLLGWRAARQESEAGLAAVRAALIASCAEMIPAQAEVAA